MEIEDVPFTTQNQIIVERLYKSGYKPSEIMELEISGLKRTTVFDQCKILGKGEKLRPKVGPGRNPLLNEEDLLILADYMIENPNSLAPAARKFIRETRGIDASEETIRRALRDLGFSYKESKNVSFMSDKAQEKRLKWAIINKGCIFNKVLFTNEATFWLGNSVARWSPNQDANENMIPNTFRRSKFGVPFAGMGRFL